jgi:hypothetical protein
VLYTDEASFHAAIGGAALAVEGFESFAAPNLYPGLTSGALSVHTFITDVNVVADPLYSTEGTNGILWGTVVYGDITFSFAEPMYAFGLDLKGVGAYSTDSIFAILRGIRYDAFIDVTGSQNDVRFLGIVDTQSSFSSVSLTTSLFASGVGLDRIQYGPVPEPGTASLLLLGLALLARSQQRRSG